jgi:CheY-like chemotaxis protein
MRVDNFIGPVLIVDDNHEVRVRLRLLLEREGYAVFTATDGLMALALMRRLSLVPRLIVLDLVMPIMDGWEFLDAFRSEPQWESSIVVIHTSAEKEHLPRGVARLRKDASDAEILRMARRYCRPE